MTYTDPSTGYIFDSLNAAVAAGYGPTPKNKIYDEDVMFITGGSAALMFRAVSAQVVDKSKTIPKHKTEAGYQISDHVVRDPVKITLTIHLLHNCEGVNEDTGIDEIGTLEALNAIDRPITVVTSVGVYQNQMIQDISYNKTGTPNIVTATVTYEEVRTSIAQTTTVTLPTLADASIPGSSTAVPPNKITSSGKAVADTGPLGYLSGFLNSMVTASAVIGGS